MSVKLQIVSDLHLEFRPDNIKFLKPSAPILCLLGDICVCATKEDFATFVAFIAEVSTQYERIIHIPGNHEYYIQGHKGDRNPSNTIQGVNKKLLKVAQTFPKYVPMINSRIQLKIGKKKLHIIGTTLWTHIPEEHAVHLQRSMNDYEYIHILEKKQMRKIRAADMNKIHKKSTSFIKRCLTVAKKEGISCVLLTHHKPVWDPVDAASKYGHGYATDLRDIIKSPLRLVAYGHTHIADRRKINGVSIVSNPRGYPGERTKFNPSFTVTVKL